MSRKQNSLLNKKFTPAALPEVYAPRQALLSRFHQAAARHFVYVGAPGGSGKTVSALLWLGASGRKSVWIGLDEYDNAPAVFYKQLATGIFSLQPDNEAMLATLTDPNFSATPVEHTIRLISEMHPADTLRAIVLDDAHLVTNGEVIKSLPAVLERLPGTFVTLILSRNLMPENFRRVIAEDAIITAEHLRFSPEEIQFYFQSMGRVITPEEARFAFISTNGLAIGVNAVAMSGHIELGKNTGMFTQYFEDNIWNTWDERTRDFCLKTSVADEFTPDFALRLTGYDDAPEIMERLSLSNAFLSRLHEDVYRFHHLFQEFLRDKAERSGIDVSALYKAAAEYYKETGDYSMALRYWINSGDYKGADTFLLSFMFENSRGNVAEYVEFLRMYFIRSFPEKAFKDFPALHVCCAWYYYMTSQYEDYEKHADAGYKNIARIALYDPKFVEFAMLMYSVDHRSRLLEKLKRFGVLSKLVKRFTGDGIIRNIASCTHNLPYAHKSSFDYCDVFADPKGMDKLRKSFFTTLCGNQSEVVLHLGEAGFRYEQNELERALKEAEWLRDAMTEQNTIELRVSAKVIHHSVLMQMGRKEEADAALNDLSAFITESAPFFLTNLEAYKTKFALLDCDKAAARAWLANYYVVDAEHIELYLVFQHFTTARAYIVLGDYDKAQKYVTMLRDFGQNLVRVCDYGEASVLLAALEWAVGKKKEAIAILEDALEKLQVYGLTRIVIDEGAAILPVLKRIALKTGKQGYAGKLKHEFVNECMISAYAFAKKYKGLTAHFIKQSKPAKLSKQQTQIITLLSKGYTNAMITKELGLKITTIKTHTSLAYQKLGVNNAMDAVLKARELGLAE
jgi:LuxR family maltose regulon positive regulatory protein